MRDATTIELNVVPLTMEEELRCSFYKKPESREDLIPLNSYEMPRKVESLYNAERLYTDFGIDKAADSTLLVSLDESPRFAKHYINQLMYEWFENRARLRDRDFVNNTVLYFLTDQDKKQDLSIFDRYVVRGTWGRITDGAELTVMYRGTMKVWNHSILAYEGPTEDFSKVIYDGEVHRYEKLMEKQRLNRKEVYPVINYNVARQLQLERPPWNPVNKVKRHARKIDAFYNRWIDDKAFKDRFSPSPDGYLTLQEDEMNRLDSRAANLLFGNDIVDKVPYSGINARFDEGEKLRAHPYPIKVYFDVWNHEDKELEDKLTDEGWVHELIEQVYQFSRLNWQTVSTSDMPVTILYPEMVAEKFPYFASDTIPEFGKRNFWFL